MRSNPSQLGRVGLVVVKLATVETLGSEEEETAVEMAWAEASEGLAAWSSLVRIRWSIAIRRFQQGSIRFLSHAWIPQCQICIDTCKGNPP